MPGSTGPEPIGDPAPNRSASRSGLGLGRRVSRSSLSGDAVAIGPALLGGVIVSDSIQGQVALRITEVEAYRGDDDPASHAFRGLTRRNAVMFDEAGHLYTYFVYGMHWCANIVTGPPGQPSAVLLRAGEVVRGVDVARTRRTDGTRPEHLGRGPAGLASVLVLAAAQNGIDLCSPDSPVRLYSGLRVPETMRCSGPRVGVSVGAEQPWRFWEAGAPSVSAYRAGIRRQRP